MNTITRLQDALDSANQAADALKQALGNEDVRANPELAKKLRAQMAAACALAVGLRATIANLR